MADMGKFRPSKKVLLSVGGVLAVLVVAGGAGFGLRMLQNGNNDNANDSRLGRALPGSAQEIQDLRAAGDDKAGKAIDDALAKESASKEERYQLYIQQGSLYSDKQDYDKAIASYSEAEKLKQTDEIYMLLGDAWQLKGDNPKAIENYKKAIPLMPDKPMTERDKARLQDKIRALGG